jgi:Formamidopyrimidine-DNA glycosylase
MLELPEANVLAAQFKTELTGKTVAKAVAAASPHGFAFYCGDPQTYGPMLQGKTVTGAKAHGGRAELELEDMRLVFNDGVNFRYLKDISAAPEKHQLLIAFTDGTGFYCTVSMYAGFLAFPAGADMGFYDIVSREKPSPLSDAFSEDYFNSLFDAKTEKLSAKAFLATEQRIPGIGNGVLQDILWESRISPKRKMNTLSPEERHSLFENVKRLLKTMTDLGGRDTEKDFFSNAGGYETILSKKTIDKPCLNCGGPIKRMAYLGGNVYLCENCQK